MGFMFIHLNTSVGSSKYLCVY